MPDYQRDLASAVADPNDPNYRVLKHLAPYAGTGKLYLGESGVAYQHRINGASIPMSLDDKAGTATGAEILANWREFAKNNPTYGTDTNAYNLFGEEVRPTADADKAYQYIRNTYGNVELDPDKLYYTQQELKGLSDLNEQMGEPKRNGKLLQPWTINEDVPTGGYKVIGVKEAPQALDSSKLAGMEQIRPGELDNAIAGLKEQLGGAFNEAWDKQYAPKLRNLTPEKRQQVRDEAEKQFWDNVDWSQYIKYDPLFGMYAPLGSVKHVNDKGVDWFTDRVAPMMPAIAAAVITGNVAAPVSAAAGAAAGSATGSTLASTAASVATKALLSSAITAGINGRKLNGRNLLLSAAASGVGAGAGDLVAGATNTAKNGLPALLASGVTRTALLNKGRIDPRLLATNTAGAYADGLLGAPVYSLGKNAYGAYNTYNRLQSNNGQARRPVRVQGRNGGLLSSGVRP